MDILEDNVQGKSYVHVMKSAGASESQGWFPSHLLQQCEEDELDGDSREIKIKAGVWFVLYI